MREPPRKLDGVPVKPARHDVGRAVGVFCALATTIVLLWRQNALLLFAALIEALAALWLWHEQYDKVFFVVLAVVSTLAEIVFVQYRVWRYANPTLFGIPIWFPVAFGTAGLAFERLATSLAMLWGQRTGAQPSDR